MDLPNWNNGLLVFDGRWFVKSIYVLWSDGWDFYVSKRIGPKPQSEDKEHFIGFFETEKAAYKEAEKRTHDRILMLTRYVRRYRRNARWGTP